MGKRSDLSLLYLSVTHQQFLIICSVFTYKKLKKLQKQLNSIQISTIRFMVAR